MEIVMEIMKILTIGFFIFSALATLCFIILLTVIERRFFQKKEDGADGILDLLLYVLSVLFADLGEWTKAFPSKLRVLRSGGGLK